MTGARTLPRIAAILTLLVPAAASAHRFLHPATIRLGVSRDRVLVSVTYDVNPGEESRLLRQLFDRDADGKLDATEQAKLATYLERTATLWLALRIDGAPAALTRLSATPARTALPSSATETVGIALLYAAPLPDAPRVRVELEDRDKDAANHVPAIVDLDPGWEVALASQGELHPRARQIQRVRLTAKTPLRLDLRRARRSPT